MYNCPNDKTALVVVDDSYYCKKCAQHFPVVSGVPIFSNKKGYWSNVPRKKMRQVIDKSMKTRDWRAVVDELIPDYARHIAPVFRGDFIHMLPQENNARVLDAGSMWGGITLPLANHFNSVCAVDQTWESLKFLKVRADEDGLRNIDVAEAEINRLPYKNKKFDIVVLNGVLEWVATENEVVLERDWSAKSSKIMVRDKSRDPETIQLEALQEIFRVTSDNGVLYLAIENRIGLQYLLGYPDDHVNIRFVSFLPRFLAHLVTKFKKGHGYRTYLYSPNSLKKLLLKAGYNTVDLYSAFPHYNVISRLVSFGSFNELGTLPLNGSAPLNTVAKIKIGIFSKVWALIFPVVRKHLCPSIVALAYKGQKTPPKIIKILESNNIITHRDFELILANNRFGDFHCLSLIVRDQRQGKNAFFVKISRKSPEDLINENEALNKIGQILKSSVIDNTFPDLVLSFTDNGSVYQITAFKTFESLETNLMRLYRSLPRHNQSTGVSIVKKIVEGRYFRESFEHLDLALSWLSEFYIASRSKNAMPKNDFIQLIKRKIEQIPFGNKESMKNTLLEIMELEDVSIHTSVSHGDFDWCNLNKHKNKIFVVDFEHSLDGQTPFFDLGNILFSNIVVAWKAEKNPVSIEQFCRAKGLDKKIKKAIKKYAEATAMSEEILRYLPFLCSLEMHSYQFTKSRDPYDYPIYGVDVLNQMASWKLDL